MNLKYVYLGIFCVMNVTMFVTMLYLIKSAHPCTPIKCIQQPCAPVKCVRDEDDVDVDETATEKQVAAPEKQDAEPEKQDAEPEKQDEDTVKWKAGFVVRFGMTGINENHYISMPMTVTDASGWTQETPPTEVSSIFPTLTMRCSPDHKNILCVLYDDAEYAAGIQIAFDKTEFKAPESWKWEDQGYTDWTSGNTKTYYTKHQYFVDEQYLDIKKEDRKTNRNKNSLLSAGGSVWVSDNKKALFEIKNKSDLLSNEQFTKQGCIPGMGHHFWRLNQQTDCKEMFPFFVLYDKNNDLVGTGMAIPGKFDPELQKDWFEETPAVVVKTIVPIGPDCLYKLYEKFVTITIFYVEDPRLNKC